MMNFRLSVFLTVADELSFTRASELLYISQPAVTKHIKELEREYGLPLLNRSGNRVTLTPAGEILRAHAQRIYTIHQELDFEINNLKERVAGEFRLGASTTLAQYVLPKVLAAFHRRFPEVHIHLLNGNTQEIEHALTEGRADLGVVEGSRHGNDLTYSDYLDDELVVTVRYDHPLRQLTFAELIAQPFVLREWGSGTLSVIETSLAQRGVTLSDLAVEMYLGGTESIKSYLVYSDCVGLLSRRAIQQEVTNKELRIVPTEGWRLKRTFYFAHLPGLSGGLPGVFAKFCRQYDDLRL